MDGLIKKPKDFLSGLLFAAVGAFLLYVSLNYAFGTARRMGPGYFPGVLASLLIFFGVILLIRSFRGRPEKISDFRLKPALLILGGSLLFGLLIMPAGLIIAVMIMVLVGTLADPDIKPVQSIVLAACLAAGSTIVFVYLLGQPIPILGSWFG